QFCRSATFLASSSRPVLPSRGRQAHGGRSVTAREREERIGAEAAAGGRLNTARRRGRAQWTLGVTMASVLLVSGCVGGASPCQNAPGAAVVDTGAHAFDSATRDDEDRKSTRLNS